MIFKKGGGITLASGIFDSYSREGWFVALQDFDLEGFVAERAFHSCSTTLICMSSAAGRREVQWEISMTLGLALPA